MTAQYRTGIRLEGDASGYRTAAQDAVAATKDLEKAQQAATTSTKGLQEAQAAAALGARRQLAETNQLREATRQLPAQITDVVTSLQAGQNPLTVFIQQGGQIRDAYGSVGAALRGIGQVLTPTVLGFTALAAAAGTLVYAAKAASDEAGQLNRDLALMGANAGRSAGDVKLLNERIAQSSNSTIGSVRETTEALLKAGPVTTMAMDDAARASLALQKLTGQDAETVAKQLAQAGTDVVAFAVKANAAYAFMSAEQFKSVVQMVEQGRQGEATRAVMTQLADAMEQRVGPAMTGLDRQLLEHNQFWSRLYATVKAFVSDATIEERLAKITGQLADIDQGKNRFGTIYSAVQPLREEAASLRNLTGRDAVRRTEAQIAAQEEQRRIAEEEKAFRERQAARARQARPRAGRAEREPPPVGFDDLDANDFRQRRLDEMATDLLPESFINRELNQQRERDNRLAEQQRLAEERRKESAMDAIEQIAQANLYANAEQITDAQERGMRMIALEESEMRRRIGLRTEDVEERRMLEDELATWRANRERALTDELKPEWRRQLEAWSDTTALMKRNFDGMVLTALQSGEDAWVRFATTGKLSITDLVNTMVAQLARGAFQQFLGQLAGAGMFGGGSNPAPAFGAGRTGQVIGAHTGGVIGVDTPTFKRNVSASLFNGAPRFHSGMLASDEYPAILQRGESVLTPGQMRAMGGAKNVQVTLINQSGTQLQASAAQRGDGGIEVLLTAMEGFMADRVGAGEGPLTQALQGRYGMRAAV